MSSLRPAQLGPLVGHTTESTARIWIRGGHSDKGAAVDENRRTVGVVTITHEDGRRPRSKPVYYFRLRREYDRTGTFTLGNELCLTDRGKEGKGARPLKPGTTYRVRVGTLSVDDPNPYDESLSNEELGQRLPDPNTWFKELEKLEPEDSEAILTTFPAGNGSSNLTFMLGSCRYPGLLWKIKESDKIFGPFLKEAKGNGRAGSSDPANFALMVGDQIYADMLNRHIPVGLADTFEEFQERYHTAFGSRNMRALLRQLPTYMILDDHEIEDNWTQDRIRTAASRRVFNIAIEAYRSYQWVHGPDSFGMRLFYKFQCGGYPFFVLDTRTQRFMDDIADQLEDNHLLGRPSLDDEEPNQLKLLLDWLKRCQDDLGDCPKFIVSSSVFAPNPMDARTGRRGSKEQMAKWAESSDSWPAFPSTRASIVQHIVENEIQNVVFLSGDIHCANVAKIEFAGSSKAKMLKAFSITSSALYWPFPFADGEPSNFVHDSKAEEQKDSFEFQANGSPHVMHYRAWNFTQDDNFCRVDVNREDAQIVVTPFGKDGEVVEKGGWFGFNGTPIRSELNLASW